MHIAHSLLLASAAYPLWKAWQANRHTSLAHALAWAWAAWAAWLAAFMFSDDGTLARYVALSLTGCAGVAVLGARRPHVGAWNFVVVSLLAVLLLPVAQGWGKPALSVPYLAFLGATVAVGWLNYLPTRLLPAVLWFGIGTGAEMAELCGLNFHPALLGATRVFLALSPWIALVGLPPRRPETSMLDQEWLSFRDRFGVVWSQRSREQFNRAAANAGWPITLSWHGFDVAPDKPTPPTEDVLATLRAVLKRFGTKEENAQGA
jgi:hypothetical protein